MKAIPLPIIKRLRDLSGLLLQLGFFAAKKTTEVGSVLNDDKDCGSDGEGDHRVGAIRSREMVSATTRGDCPGTETMTGTVESSGLAEPWPVPVG